MKRFGGWVFCCEDTPDDLTEEAPLEHRHRYSGPLGDSERHCTEPACLPARGLLPALDPWACPTCGGNPCRYSCFEEE